MNKDKAVKVLESLLNELKSAYYGGYRAVTDESDHEAIQFAIESLSELKSNSKLKDEFEANIVREGYVGWNGWVEEIQVNIDDGMTLLEDKLENFEGKKVRFIIEDLNKDKD